ncbi:high osmolarity signaling protein SHO1 [Ceratobasidium sp. AG-Ba]|nr:high osmolarity signaling protein SHO1 [Ceratobasidium sp. AG-Ba]
MARGEGYDFRPLITHYLFLVTFILAFAGWLTAFIGQAATTAQFGNAFVGTLWFGIFLELFLIIGVLHTLASDSIGMHRLQISVFGAIGIVYAVQGAHAGLYASAPAAQAMGAGWLLLAFVNILWTLYFTAEEDSLMLHTFNSLGSGSGLSPASRSGGNRRRHTTGHTQRGSNGYAGAGKEEHMGMGGMGMGGGMAPMHTGATGMSMGPGANTMTGRPMSQEAARSIGAGTHGGRSIVPPGGGGAAVGNDPEAGSYAYKARALYAYTASPDDPAEISFTKGEILDIVDNNGKWWQARKENGTTGTSRKPLFANS